MVCLGVHWRLSACVGWFAPVGLVFGLENIRNYVCVETVHYNLPIRNY